MGTESQTCELQLKTLNVDMLLAIHSQISMYKERDKRLTLQDEINFKVNQNIGLELCLLEYM